MLSKGSPRWSRTWPLTTTRTSAIIHLIRNTFRLTSQRDPDRLKRYVRLIYTAPNEVKSRGHFPSKDGCDDVPLPGHPVPGPDR